ncbi:GGDEF domain-containing protein [Ramlibacter sp. MMS24-I3-19]|uniref:GGDEF domain-containing protein n=1 Tax=Ramlibacter sp. MMS24-I3-19 TaxID=3416606 RepID=UPI003CFF8ED6
MDPSFAPTQFDMDEQPTGAAPSRSPTRLHTWLQRLGLRARRGLRDAQTGLYNRAGLLTLGEHLLARHGTADATLVVFDFSDLLEMRWLYGPRAGAIARRTVAATLTRIAGRRGLAARTGPAQFAVLLPGADCQRARDALRRALGHPCRLELELGREELVLVPYHAVAPCKTAPGDLERQYMQLSEIVARERASDERRRRRSRSGSRSRGTASVPPDSQSSSLPASLP